MRALHDQEIEVADSNLSPRRQLVVALTAGMLLTTACGDLLDDDDSSPNTLFPPTVLTVPGSTLPDHITVPRSSTTTTVALVPETTTTLAPLLPTTTLPAVAPLPGDDINCFFDGNTAPGSDRMDRGSPRTAGLYIYEVETGDHDCSEQASIRFDGDVTGGLPGWEAGYVEPNADGQFLDQASGEPVTVRGNAFLRLRIGAPPYDENFTHANYAVDLTQLELIQDYAIIEANESYTTIIFGLDKARNFNIGDFDGNAACARGCLILQVGNNPPRER